MLPTPRMGELPYVKSTAGGSLEASSYMASQLVEEMSNAELVKTVDAETHSNRQIFLENDVFERYLRRAEPPALVNMEQMMQQSAQTEARHQRISAAASRAGSFTVVGSSMSLANVKRPDSKYGSASVMGLPYELRPSASPSMTRTMLIMKEAPSINVSHKIDMVTREMEELKISFEHLTKVYTIRKAHLKAEIEAISTMLGELKTTQAELIDKVVIKGIEPLTKKTPARVFTRFMDEWFRKTDLLSGQLRLKINTYKCLYMKLSQQLEEKIELGETLKPVDFEFQKIRIQEVSKELKSKNFDLALLKKKTANTHREFTAFNDRLAEQLAQLSKLKSKTVEKERNIEEMIVEAKRVQADIAVSEADLERIVRIRKLYTVPDVLEYARVKYEGDKVRREMRNWTRRTGLQQKEISSIRQKLYHVNRELNI